MPGKPERLKLGKGKSFFVKSQLRQLRQKDETWGADFLPLPCSGGREDRVCMGMILSQAQVYLHVQRMVEDLLSVDDLADSLAQAMKHPMNGPIK